MTAEGFQPAFAESLCGDDGHNWRLFESEEVTHYPPTPDPFTTNVVFKTVGTITTYDTWYCTKCRRVERLARCV